jgi:hypothetical protein
LEIREARELESNLKQQLKKSSFKFNNRTETQIELMKRATLKAVQRQN